MPHPADPEHSCRFHTLWKRCDFAAAAQLLVCSHHWRLLPFSLSHPLKSCVVVAALVLSRLARLAWYNSQALQGELQHRWSKTPPWNAGERLRCLVQLGFSCFVILRPGSEIFERCWPSLTDPKGSPDDATLRPVGTDASRCRS